jgi:alpha-tubulin suppressor-like RCC1 family protein
LKKEFKFSLQDDSFASFPHLFFPKTVFHSSNFLLFQYLILALIALDIVGVIGIIIRTWRRFVMKKNKERIKKIEVKGWLPKDSNVKSFYLRPLLFILPTLFILLLSTPLAINAQIGFGWGNNSGGQLGNGHSDDVPEQALISGVTAIAAGGDHSLALKQDGTVWAWGANGDGQLGNGTNTDSNVPVPVSGLTKITAIAGGTYHSLVLKQDGTVWAWGTNWSGQLGNGTWDDSNVPVQVLNLSGITAIAGGGYHSLALKQDGTVWAWGYNEYGQLGNGTNADSNVPVPVSGLKKITAIAGGTYHSLALKQDGTVWAWGDNEYGQLGNGTNTDSNVPVQVLNLSGITAIAVGGYHSLALKQDGTVWAWGNNEHSQLGNETYPYAYSNVPVQVLNLSGVTGIAGGDWHSLALKQDGTVWAWGDNEYSQLGNETYPYTYSNVPVKVLNLSGITAVTGGWGHSLALKQDRTVWAWGCNYYGQLGNGTTTNSYGPVQVLNLSAVTAIAGGGLHSLAIFGGDYPTITNIIKAKDPFRLKIYGSNFHSDLKVYIGGDSNGWEYVKYKSSTEIVLKGGAALKAKFPKGVPVQIKVVNGDGGYAVTTYTR